MPPCPFCFKNIKIYLKIILKKKKCFVSLFLSVLLNIFISLVYLSFLSSDINQT
jgi:hypothetical protein